MWKFVSAGSSGSGHPIASLNEHQGRHTWEFDATAGTPEQRKRAEELREAYVKTRFTQHNSADELLRLQAAPRLAARKLRPPTSALPDGVPEEARVAAHLRGAISYYECLQQDDGHWPGDYGGPLFLYPGLVITCYTCGVLDQVFSPEAKQETLRYLRNHQNKDGGFGLHIEGPSTMFGTILNYVMARLMGMGPSDDLTARSRGWIHEHGGMLYNTSWGKFWMAVLGIYSWDGINPLTPEMWLLPHAAWTGVGWMHPGRFWCHCRMVYLPMSYVYGRRGTCAPTALTAELRSELYSQPYDEVNWNSARNLCCKTDLYYPHPAIQDVVWWVLYKAENLLLGSRVRRSALAECMKLIHYEDRSTRYIDIGPVNKCINMLSCWLEDPNSDAFKGHLARIPDYLWVAEDGMKMNGYNGSQLWDTSFAVQAIAETGLLDASASCLHAAHRFVEQSQVREDGEAPLTRYYRHISKGAWPFSTRDHGWPISDCSSEGLKAALMLAQLPSDKVGAAIPVERLQDCVNVLLSYQNSDGGMATYENTRSFAWMETLNPAETFGDIIIDYSYVECTSACITALVAFRRQHKTHRADEIIKALDKAEAYVRSIQRPDGSWYGSWAVCFTYACWFGVAALAARGHTYATDKAVMRCCQFLVKHQQTDGGWGESYLSCQDKVYSHLPGGSHMVNTSWAMLTLLLAGYHQKDAAPLHRAARFLLQGQQPSGDWPQQHISGVFNRNCMITYANYRNIFPIWALGRYRRQVLLGEAMEA